MDEACLLIGRIVAIGAALFSVALLLIILFRKMGGRDNLSDYMSLEDIAMHHPDMLKCQVCGTAFETLPSKAMYCKSCNPLMAEREREFHEMAERHAREEAEERKNSFPTGGGKKWIVG